MSETSKLQKYLMWYKVKELFSNGLNKSQIGISLGSALSFKRVLFVQKYSYFIASVPWVVRVIFIPAVIINFRIADKPH